MAAFGRVSRNASLTENRQKIEEFMGTKVEAKKRFKQMKELEKQVIANRNEMLTKRKEKTLAKKKEKQKQSSKTQDINL